MNLPTATLRLDVDQSDQLVAIVVLIDGEEVAVVSPKELKQAAFDLHDCEVRAEYKRGPRQLGLEAP